MSKAFLIEMTLWEGGGLSARDTIELFAKLIESGLAWQLQGSYGRLAQNLIDNGFISREGVVLIREDDRDL